MQSVLVVSSKGGCGKTTIATNLASAFAVGGHRTAIADTDHQRSSLHWLERRASKLGAVEGYDWTEEIGKPGKKIERLVIDSPAGIRKKRLDVLVKRSDVVLVPILPSIFDEDATREFLSLVDSLKTVRKKGSPIGIVANRMRARTIASAQLEQYLYTESTRVVARLRDSQVYPAAACYGLGLADLGTTRAREVFEDWNPLLDFVETCFAVAS